EVADCDLAVLRARRGQAAIRKQLALPAGSAAGARESLNRRGRIDAGHLFSVDRHTGPGRHLARPLLLPVGRVETGDSTLVGRRTHLVVLQADRAEHIGQPLDFGCAFWFGYRAVPARSPV